MRKKGFFSYQSYLCLCRFKKTVQGNTEISLYIYINIFILRCRIEPQVTENLCKALVMNGLYCAIDCTVFIWDEMSDVESVAISFNNSLIAVNLTVSPGSGSNVCSRKLHRKINRGFFMGLINWGRSWKRKTSDPEKPKVYWVAEARLELTTFGLWAQRATTAPLRDVVVIISDFECKGTTYFW